LGFRGLVAFALRADGWYLRQDIIWSKPNPMPESVQDRCTKAHEYLFMLSKSQRYYYDIDAIKEPAVAADIGAMDGGAQRNKDGSKANAGRNFRSDKQRGHGRRHAGFNERWDQMECQEQCSGMRNKRSVWNVATQPFAEAHFATFPPTLIEPCILAGCPAGGTVLDPFGGAGTTGLVADRLGRSAILIELNPDYATMAERRIKTDAGMLAEVTTLSQAKRD
jgi:DNA modification methylase